MCLIMVGPSANIRNLLLRNGAELLADVYKKNGDGVGVMYNTTGGVRAIKYLPKTLAKIKEFVESFPADDREVAVHFRWRTHGAIDKENCHPYAVDDGFMMHNGVLHTGNWADKTKSDTWHFCRDYLDGFMTPMIHHPKMRKLFGDFIDNNNRFVFLTADGKMSIVNRETGPTHEGVWFSNEYAWDPSIVDPTYMGGYNARVHEYMDEQRERRSANPTLWTPSFGEWQEAIYENDVKDLKCYLNASGAEGLAELFDDMYVVRTAVRETLAEAYEDACAALYAQDLDALEEIIKSGDAGVARLAECMAYFTTWAEHDVDEVQVEGDYEDPFHDRTLRDHRNQLSDAMAAAEMDWNLDQRMREAQGFDHLNEEYAA